jgi:hypothetical protein
MSTSLIRSRAMVTHAIDRHRWNEITDGAVLQVGCQQSERVLWDQLAAPRAANLPKLHPASLCLGRRGT